MHHDTIFNDPQCHTAADQMQGLGGCLPSSQQDSASGHIFGRRRDTWENSIQHGLEFARG
jgi:hypothetical protein